MAIRKIIPTEEELLRIQDMINCNDSISTIAKKVHMSDKTVKRVLEEYSIDLSNYNPRIAHGKKIKKTLSQEDLSLVLSMLEKGISIRQIVKDLDVSVPTLNNILTENGIDPSQYKRKSHRKFELSPDDIEQIERLKKSGKTIKEISEHFGVNRNTFSQEYRLSVPSETKFNANIKKIVNEMHQDYITVFKISKLVGLGPKEVNDLIEDKSINEPRKHKEHMKDNYDEESILLSYIKQYGIGSVSKEQISFCKENIDKIPFIEIAKLLCLHPDQLSKALKIIYSTPLFNYETLNQSLFKDEFQKDLSTSAYSNSYLGLKYGISNQTVSKWRKNLFGDSLKTYYDTRLSKSTLEVYLESIMDALGIAYIFQYRVGSYDFDYYIGHKTLIEVNGVRFHDGEEDNKRLFAEEFGYSIFPILEEEFVDLEKLQNKIFNIYVEAFKKAMKLQEN